MNLKQACIYVTSFHGAEPSVEKLLSIYTSAEFKESLKLELPSTSASSCRFVSVMRLVVWTLSSNVTSDALIEEVSLSDVRIGSIPQDLSPLCPLQDDAKY